MKGRFGAKSSGGILRSVIPTVCFFVAIMFGFLWMVSNMTGSVEGEQLKSTEQAIRRTAVHCYAIEGRYPESLKYMEDHYGLRVNKEQFVIHYQPVGANLMPAITVFPMSELNAPETESTQPVRGNPVTTTIVIDDDDAI